MSIDDLYLSVTERDMLKITLSNKEMLNLSVSFCCVHLSQHIIYPSNIWTEHIKYFLFNFFLQLWALSNFQGEKGCVFHKTANPRCSVSRIVIEPLFLPPWKRQRQQLRWELEFFLYSPETNCPFSTMALLTEWGPPSGKNSLLTSVKESGLKLMLKAHSMTYICMRCPWINIPASPLLTVWYWPIQSTSFCKLHCAQL